jgi:NTP pyrophosphatase (non-canonical NTP hydrolase)
MNKITKLVTKFRDDRDWKKFHTPANLAKSISIEANELLEHFQWSDKKFKKAELVHELADVLIYCYQMADILGVDVEKIIQDKLVINNIKYPKDLVRGSSKKYSEYK